MRRLCKQINIGNVLIGGNAPIAIQSMCNVKTSNTQRVIEQINALQGVGCDIVRLSLFDDEDVEALRHIVEAVTIPIVADIHFNADYAVAAIECGIAKIRINPGNFPTNQLKRIVDCAKAHGICMRIGVNGGSVDKSLLIKYGNKNDALLASVSKYIDLLNSFGFNDLVLSVKSSNVDDTVLLNTRLAVACDYPIHIGLTEAGLPETGIVRNALAAYRLLSQGIGDTLRVSLTANPLQEVLTAKAILAECGFNSGVRFVSCPKCGRCQIDLEGIARKVYDYCASITVPITVAVMGCEVNGPGECADADIGLAGGKMISFFKKGKIYKTVPPEQALELFIDEIQRITDAYRRD